MALLDGEGWTVVTRRRRRTKQSPERALFRPHGQNSYHTQLGARLSYADTIKYGAFNGNTNTYRNNPPWSNGPQFFEPRVRPGPARHTAQRAPFNARPRTRQTGDSREGIRYLQKERNRRQGIKPQYPSDPEFVRRTRCILKLIKITHHQNNIVEGPPPAITKLEKFLANIIQPALPNPNTQNLIRDNAKKWVETTMSVLDQHYAKALTALTLELYDFPHENWEDCFHLACKWAKRDMGRRLRQATCDEVHDDLRDMWPASDEGPGAILEEPVSQGDLQPSSPRPTGDDNRAVPEAMVHAEASPQSRPVSPDPEIEGSQAREINHTDLAGQISPGSEELMESPLETLLGLLIPSPGGQYHIRSSAPKEQVTPKGPRTATPTYLDDPSDPDLVLVEVQGGTSQTSPVRTHKNALSRSQVANLRAAVQTRLTPVSRTSTPPLSRTDACPGGSARAGFNARPSVITPPLLQPDTLKGRLRRRTTMSEATYSLVPRTRLHKRTEQGKVSRP